MLENYHMIALQNMIYGFECHLIAVYPETFDRFELEDIGNSLLLMNLVSLKYFMQSFKFDLYNKCHPSVRFCSTHNGV